MKPELTQIPGVFPAHYVSTWKENGDAVLFSRPTDFSVAIYGELAGKAITLVGSLDGTDVVPIRDAQGDLIRFSAPGIYPVATTVLHVAPILPKEFVGAVKVMAS